MVSIKKNGKKILRITTVATSLKTLLKGQLYFLNRFFEIVGVAYGADKLLEVAESEQIKVREVKMYRNISIVQDLKSLVSLIYLIYVEKPYIVHSNTPKASLLSMIAAWICRVPHRIYTVTGLRFETTKGFLRKLLIFMEKVTCLCATKVIPEGEGVKKSLRRENITTKPLEVILNGNINGIDTRFFSAGAVDKTKEELRKEFNIPQSSFVFIFVGRMVRDKGINELVAAFSQLYPEDKNTRLLLVGPYENELDPLLPETIDAIDNHPGIVAVGFQKDVRPFFKLADALTFPSYREGFPNVVMQAGAMGLPAIVTDINGCNEIILEGKNGVIIPSQNTSALFAAMKDFLLAKEATQKMAKQSRSLITSRYEQKEVWKAILEMYQSLE